MQACYGRRPVGASAICSRLHFRSGSSCALESPIATQTRGLFPILILVVVQLQDVLLLRVRPEQDVEGQPLLPLQELALAPPHRHHRRHQDQGRHGRLHRRRDKVQGMHNDTISASQFISPAAWPTGLVEANSSGV